MTDAAFLAKRILWWRAVLWLAALLLALLVFAGPYPLAPLVAGLGLLVTLFWPLARHLLELPQGEKENAGNREQGIGNRDTSAPDADDLPFAFRLFPFAIGIGLDLLLVTALIAVSGGFVSAFAPLLFLVVVEAFALLGPFPALATALAAALLSLLHFRAGITAQTAALYGTAIGALLLSATLVAWSQRREDSPLRRSTVLKTRTLEQAEAERKELAEAHEQLKNNYREVAHLNREQKTRLEHLLVAEQLYSASTTIAITDGDATQAHARLLRIVMDRLDAGGGVLWLCFPEGDTLIPQAVAGRVASSLHEDILSDVKDLSPAELRALCEDRLRAAALQREEKGKTEDGNEKREDGKEEIVDQREYTEYSEAPSLLPTSDALPVVVVLLRDPADGDNTGRIWGAVGICDPRGASRFNLADAEHLQTLAHPLAVALANVEQRYGLQRRVRELSMLYDLSRLVQTATDMEQVYKAIIAQVQTVIPYENGTLFLLDKEQNRLEARATRGRVVNLLDHISFEKGAGVSGWVAARGRQVVIPDLQKEPNLLNVEMIPPRIRAFVAMPLRVQNNVVGVINLSHSRPNAFTQEHLQFLTILAGQAAVTIERTEVFHALETLAITDGLTQVYNRRYFQRRLEDEIRRSKRYHAALSLVMIDADEFKAVNDRYGHASGDVVLRDLATLLRRSLRETEIVARYGGEEFAVILPQTGVEQALIAAERVRAQVATHAFTSTDGQTFHLTISIGVAAVPLHAQAVPNLIEQADRALYAAKEGGRNRVCAASTEKTNDQRPTPEYLNT